MEAMATESMSKQQKLEENNVVREKEDLDWISTFPDSILLHILSFLPTKTSVATMPLVSRRWRYLWKDLQVFDFYDEACDETDFKRFANFFKAVLTLRRSRDIRKMSFYHDHSFDVSDTFPEDSINMCIGEAMGPCLEELHINIGHAYNWGIVDIPSTLFECTNLVSLSLKGAIDWDMGDCSTQVHFPSLRNLYLKIYYLDSVGDLILGCPVLETLSIIDTRGLYCSSFRVPHSLKRLEYQNRDDDKVVNRGLRKIAVDPKKRNCGPLFTAITAILPLFTAISNSAQPPQRNATTQLRPQLPLLTTEDDDYRTYIEIDAPQLEYLSIHIYGSFKAAVGNLLNVEEAHIDVTSESDFESESEGDSESEIVVLNLLRALSGTKHLSLSHFASERLLRASVLRFPELCYLLHLGLELLYFNSIFLFDVLEKCHLLQYLIIQSYQLKMPLQTWEPQSTRIPKCLVSHLTSIQIKGYRGLEDELTFAKYILQNALVLKTMIIKSDITLNLEEKHRIVKKLSKMPRGSNMCQLEFD